MFGMSAAYIEHTKGITDPIQRKLIRYCITDVYVANAFYNKFYRNGLYVRS